jgi:hypothetical protein
VHALNRDCTLDPDSLDPLAQLTSLRKLELDWCTGITLTSLEHLFTTSVQGCLLQVNVHRCPDMASEKACSQMREHVLAQRGSRDTPMLSLS